ncbi:MAG: Holliday junction branch migration protein RuvA [Candidatus Aminicenantes bacterium]|nr:Holliday junction branch migration protein RuvA [Candidatus Aminicenantes bacterium]
MIAHLKGIILHKSPAGLVVDCGGVGYAAAIPLSTFLKVGEEGEPVELFVHTHLTDNALSLFGFLTLEEKDIFLKLISISGIGPKLAIAVLSGMDAETLAEAVRSSDVTRIAMVPGIGKKTALRIAMELADKIDKKERLLKSRASKETEDLVSALLNMGFRRKEIEPVVEETVKARKGEGFEVMLRESLKALSRV